jgi:hypothetical protein
MTNHFRTIELEQLDTVIGGAGAETPSVGGTVMSGVGKVGRGLGRLNGWVGIGTMLYQGVQQADKAVHRWSKHYEAPTPENAEPLYFGA